MVNVKKIALNASILAAALIAPSANAAESIEQAFKDGTFYLDARYRYEYASQDNRSSDAHASTLRTRIGYKTGTFENFSGTIEFEDISQIGSDNYNDTLNGRTNHPVVADVENTEVNQAFLQFDGLPETSLKLGRQGIDLDNQRFIGTIGWRQNNQTMDAVTLNNQTLPDTTIFYGYVNNVNRIFGDNSPNGDFNSNSHMLNISNKSTPLGTIVGYAYLLDFRADAPELSSKTFGGYITGAQKLNEDFTFKYRAEYAQQSDFGSNNTNYTTDYIHLAPAIAWNGLTTTLAYEQLGSNNGNIGFSTPLSTAHKFNGWADLFLNTPANGLRDYYVDLTYVIKDVEGELSIFNDLLLKGQYHDFTADNGGANYGTEFDFYVKKPINEHYYVEAKYGDYHADTFGTDTRRFIFGVGVKY